MVHICEVVNKDVGEFFMKKVLEMLIIVAAERPDGTYFINRYDFRLRLARIFNLRKEESRLILKMLEKSGVAKNANRGIVICSPKYPET